MSASQRVGWTAPSSGTNGNCGCCDSGQYVAHLTKTNRPHRSLGQRASVADNVVANGSAEPIQRHFASADSSTSTALLPEPADNGLASQSVGLDAPCIQQARSSARANGRTSISTGIWHVQGRVVSSTPSCRRSREGACPPVIRESFPFMDYVRSWLLASRAPRQRRWCRR